jgi:hypothetical protein
MATEQRLITYGFPASADLSASQFCAVNVDANGNLALATAGKNCDGVLQDKPNALGQAGEIALFGVSKVLSGGTGFSAGDLLEVAANGTFQTKNAGTVVAKAVTTAAAAAIGSAILLKSNAVYA